MIHDMTGLMLEKRATLAAATALKSAVEERWTCTADLVQAVPVRARIEGAGCWNVDVNVFALTGCAKAYTAYAWIGWEDDRQQIFTALDIGPIRSAMDAVCAVAADRKRARRLATLPV